MKKITQTVSKILAVCGLLVNTFVIDLFCGAGGTSTAIYESMTNVKVVACINHDKNAIISHLANYPDCLHFTEDIRTIAMGPLVELVNRLRLENPGCKIAIWASLECTNHSRAKGGQSRDADSRSLADHLIRYIDALTPEFVWIENVREFMEWGPLRLKEGNGSTKLQCEIALDKKGDFIFVPVKEQRGIYYNAWVELVKGYGEGYSFDHRLLNSADFGGYTSRERFFAQFSTDPDLIAWPEQTHAKEIKKNEKLLESLAKWKPVREVLDLADEGVSIFERKKPLSENTLARIYAGLLKFVANGDESFLKTYYSGSGQVLSMDGPARTITTIDHHAIVKSLFLSSYYGNGTLVGSDSPCGTLTTKDRFNMVSVKPWLINMNSSTAPAKDLSEPSPTITSVRTHYIINPSWFSMSASSVENPSPTLVARQDKAPLSVVSTERGEFAIAVFEGDSPYTEKIKMFMAAYGICDVKMRMLKVGEMLKIQGFPDGYKLIGTQAEQKKYIGNSVEVAVGKALFRAIDSKINTPQYEENNNTRQYDDRGH